METSTRFQRPPEADRPLGELVQDESAEARAGDRKRAGGRGDGEGEGRALVTQQQTPEEVQERVSANPLPYAAVIGGGIALLLVLRLRRRR
jgi:hypothetical protein